MTRESLAPHVGCNAPLGEAEGFDLLRGHALYDANSHSSGTGLLVTGLATEYPLRIRMRITPSAASGPNRETAEAALRTSTVAMFSRVTCSRSMSATSSERPHTTPSTAIRTSVPRKLELQLIVILTARRSAAVDTSPSGSGEDVGSIGASVVHAPARSAHTRMCTASHFRFTGPPGKQKTPVQLRFLRRTY
jgi:hypothetical protein